eukprot:10408390-Alexandrium_andersonii.AAC.1
MVTILKALWARDIRTFMSCEDNNGNIWITFELPHFKRFARQASPCLDDFLHHSLVDFQWPFRYDEHRFCDVGIRFPLRYKEAFEHFLAEW